MNDIERSQARIHARKLFSIFGDDPGMVTLLAECFVDRAEREHVTDVVRWMDAVIPAYIREHGHMLAVPVPGGMGRPSVTPLDMARAHDAVTHKLLVGAALLLCLALPMACEPSAGPPQKDAPAVVLLPQPWCMDVAHVEDTRVTVLHMGVHAEGRSAFRFDVLTGQDEAHILPGRYLEPSDGHLKIRIEEDATSPPWESATVVVYTARGDHWERSDSRGGMPRCTDG